MTRTRFLSNLNKKKNLYVILTIPHALCPPVSRDHNCDTIAPESAKFLSKLFDDNNIQNITLFGDIPRNKLDLNREESKASEFQRKLNNLIDAYMKQYNLILFDIHSGEYEKDISLVILKQKNISIDCLKLLNIIQNNTNAIIMIGSELNYITENTIKQEIPALLFEFNEKKYYTLSFYEKIVNSLIEWHFAFK